MNGRDSLKAIKGSDDYPMRATSTVIVIIPVYKLFSTLKASEVKSFAQCLSVLKGRKVCLAAPEKLNVDGYKAFARNNGATVEVEKFRDGFFKNIHGYNRLLLSASFYQRFGSWQYLLIYQLDAWVFSDQLDLWMGEGYDFIGAPLFEGFHKKSSTKFTKGLNGGFSLRSVQASIRLAKRIRELKGIYKRLRIFSLFTIRSLKPFLNSRKAKAKYRIKSFEKLDAAVAIGRIFEDYYWSKFVEEAFTDFRVADSKIALRFCFEVNSDYLYTLNDNQLPFGSHAWEKYEPEFWKNFIPV